MLAAATKGPVAVPGAQQKRAGPVVVKVFPTWAIGKLHTDAAISMAVLGIQWQWPRFLYGYIHTGFNFASSDAFAL